MGALTSSRSELVLRRVLLVDDDPSYLTVLRLALRSLARVECVTAASAEEALDLLRSEPFDLLLTDVHLPGRSGIELIATARAQGLRTPALVLTGYGSVSDAVEALKVGASDYLQKPVEPTRLKALVDALLTSNVQASSVAPPEQSPEPASTAASELDGLLGVSPAMQELFARIDRVAQSDATVLVLGESGTGKELVARAIHRRGRRAHGPFVPVHTGAIPRELIASELFGHEKGAFTGATAATDGKFDAAARGTLFLDEISTMETAVQVSLLRVLETFRFTRVGGRRERDADVRIVAATNRDLLAMSREGGFREDLYYRLSVLTLTLPPLREREGDVALLALHFLTGFARRYGTRARTLSPAAITRLCAHRWPGNVRELRNVMEQTAVFATGEEVSAAELRLEDSARAPSVGGEATPATGVARVEVPVLSAAPSSPGSTATPPGGLTREGAASELSSSPPTRATVGGVFSRPAASPERDQLARAARRALRIPEGEGLDEDLVLTFALGTTIDAMERALVVRTLEVLGGNKQRAARVLGISRRSLYNKLASYGLHAVVEPNDAGEEPVQDDDATAEPLREK